MSEPLRFTPDGLVDMGQFDDEDRPEDLAVSRTLQAWTPDAGFSDEIWQRGLHRISRNLSDSLPKASWSDGLSTVDISLFGTQEIPDEDWAPIRAALRTPMGHSVRDRAWKVGLSAIQEAHPIAGFVQDVGDPNDGPNDSDAVPLFQLDTHKIRRSRSQWLSDRRKLILVAAAVIGVLAVAVMGNQSSLTVTERASPGTTTSPSANPLTPSGQGMVRIPDGDYVLGTDKPDPNAAETRSTTQRVAEFFIDAFEVSNEQYKQFVDEKEAAVPQGWPDGRYPEDKAQHPVQGVRFEWAQAYCTSLGKRLPSEAEWEVAARGPDGRPFPWGVNAAEGGLPSDGTYAKGTVAANVSPFGVYDLAGNAWEWVADTYDNRVDPTMHVLRGGQNGYLRTNTSRLPVADTSNASRIAGFRCAASTVDDTAPALSLGDVALPDKDNEPTPTTLPDGVLFPDDFQDATSGWVEKTTDTSASVTTPTGSSTSKPRPRTRRSWSRAPTHWTPTRKRH